MKNREEKDVWKSVKYRIGDEGFDYCFEGYSDWKEIEDGEFHRLRNQYLDSKKELKKYIDLKIEEI